MSQFSNNYQNIQDKTDFDHIVQTSIGNGCYSFHSIHDALFHDKTLQRKFKVLSLGNSLENPSKIYTQKERFQALFWLPSVHDPRKISLFI